jgi:hypothetical protein
MSLDFNVWAQKSDTEKVYLVETSVRRLADGAILPLYLANRDILLEDRFYLGCTIGLPRLIRQANGSLSPNRISTWGELELRLEQDYRPDAQNSIPWLDLLSSAYNFRGQALTIKVGDPAWTYADFRTIFAGGLDKYRYDDTTMTAVVYDKTQDLKQKLPDYALPESPRVEEDRWDEVVPLVLGPAKNYKPALITTANPGAYPWKYALSCHVLDSLVNAYWNNTLLAGSNYSFVQKDLLPARKDGIGSAVIDLFGPYTGSLIQAEWMIEIDSITALNSEGNSGPAVGLATFKYSTDGGFTWLETGILTWKLAPDTVTKGPAAGNAMMAASGYDGDIKKIYKVKVSRGGHITDVPCPQFVWSDDGGLTWSDPVDILDNDPIALNRGLSVAFGFAGGGPGSGAPGSGATNSWYWVGTGSGQPIFVEGNENDVYIVITSDGASGTATFDWVIGELSGSGTTSVNPQEISPGYTVLFTANGNPGQEDYYSGDESSPGSTYYPPFIIDDLWTWTFKEIPIPLADGVSIKFTDRGTSLAQGVDAARFLSYPDDFALGDNWRFILGSTVAFALQITSGTITVDVLGLVSPAVGYTDKIGEMIRALPQGWRGWSDADFDLPALAAFNTAIPYQAALVVTSPNEIASIIDQLLTGIPALYTMTQAGKFFIAELALPSGAPVLELTDVELQQAPEGEDGDDDLYRRVYLRYDRNYNQENNPQNAPSQDRLAWLQNEFRQVSARDETVLSSYPWAGDLGPLDTCLVLRDEAKALASKNLELFKVKHPALKVTIKIQPFLLDIWQPVSLRRTRYGEVEGKNYAIAGKEENYSASEAILNLWC